MNSWIFVSIGAGLAAAALHAAVATGSPASFLLFYLAPLPLFLAGFGWGAVAAAAGALAGGVALIVLSSVKTAIFFVVTTGIAPVILSHLSLINRSSGSSGASEGEAADQGREWYPEGRLILWCALFAIIMMTATVFIVGGSADGFHAMVQAGIDTIVERMGSQTGPDELENILKVTGALSVVVAPIAATVWLLSTLFNMWAASRILSSSGRSLRPWAPFASYSLPHKASYALAGAALASFLPGTLGLIGWIAMAVMTSVYAIIGLATLHGITIGNPMRGFILFSVYLALFVLSWVIVLPLVILGVADQIFGLRKNKRPFNPPGPPNE